MNELIKITKDENLQETVNARDLHSFLEVGRDFSNWIKQRIEKYDFQEGSDFTTILAKSNGGRPCIEYYLSIEMSKELSMIENNEKGKQARKFFIERDKKLARVQKQQILPTDYISALQCLIDSENKKLELIEQNNQQKEIIEDNKPKVEVFEKYISSDSSSSMAQTAKLLNIKDPNTKRPIGRNGLFILLKKKGILDRSNIPYQQYVNRGYFEVKDSNYTLNSGEVKTVSTTKVTPKGKVYLGRVLSEVSND